MNDASGTTVDPTLFNDLSYTYLANGSIETISTDPASLIGADHYTYDALNRLTQDCVLSTATECDPGSINSFAYDVANGNLATQDEISLSYTDAAHKHAVTSASNGNTYTYDANGNQITRIVAGVSYTLTYDAENRLTGITGGTLTASYVYDGDGNRVKTVVDGTTTIYIGNYYEVKDPGEGQAVKKYYYAGGTRVAMSDNGEVRYFVTDHLGSTTRLINTNGTEYSETEYLSWGTDGLAPALLGTSFKYTGQREAEAGLYFYNARWRGAASPRSVPGAKRKGFDPEIGRFIQADSIIPEPGNPLGWDRYAYANNNPVKFIDPSGHKACEDQGNAGSQVCVNVHSPHTVTPKPPRDALSSLKEFYNSWVNVSKAANWSLEIPGSLTLFKSGGYPLMGGFRLWTSGSVTLDNNSPLTLGSSSIAFGPIKFAPNGARVSTTKSTIDVFGDEFMSSLNISHPNPPFGISIAAQNTVSVDNIDLTYNLGVDYIYPRTDNMGFIITIPALVVSSVNIVQSGRALGPIIY